ncbi:MAG: DNA polymerase III subunit alpha [Holdemanella biformis]|nr:DNA polymerase III subunit alpha [Holdemanella biformis]
MPSPTSIVDKAIELGINMVGISEHESLSSHIILNKYAQEIKEQYPDFKIALGNEIYLTETRDKNQKYYHSLLCAKDAIGHQTLRELSSIAWINSYYDRGLQRVPLLYEELEKTINKYGNGHLIMSSACIGSIIGQQLLAMREAENINDSKSRKIAHDKIVKHVLFCKKLFGDDFYLEIAPALYEEQIYVNKKTLQLGEVFDLKVTIQDDSHRLTQEDYTAHKALLNSKQGEREDIDSFYKYTYLQSYDDIRKHMEPVGCDCDKLFANSMEMYDKVEEYSLLHSQQVPMVSVPNYPVADKEKKYEYLNQLYKSDNEQERYWVNFCVDKLKEKDLYNDIYLSELNEEARVQIVLGKKLDTCIFSYPIFLQHYFDLIWECGSCVGVGRGSSAAGLDNYLMDLTQYDPIKAGVNNYFRYLNETRTELPDLDFDLAPTVRPKWFEKIKEERGSLGLIQVCTFSTMSSRASILSACRGYRSKDYPNGIDNDQAQYLTSLVGSDRGITYTIKEMIEGNKEKGLKPNAIFIKTVNQYPGLLDIIQKLEGTVSNRSIHASGIIFNDPGHEFDNGAIMTAPDGTLISQWSLHDAEAAGKTKIDSLVTDVMEKITQTLLLLQSKDKIDKNLSLREVYNKYIHPDVLPLEDKNIWDEIDKGNINNLFQFDTQVGSQAVKKLQPRNLKQLSAINALIRLMPQEKGAETPVDRYYRIKNNPNEWYIEMDSYGLTKEEQNIIKEYCENTYGTLPLQDDLMLMMMDKRLFGFDLEDANSARKIIGKKLVNKIPELHKKILEKAESPALGKYIYDVLFSSQLGYAFNAEHCYSYSMIGLQCAYLAVKYPSIYWNTGCLRVDSGLEEEASTNYGKIAKAVGKINNQGINFSLIDINKSEYMFEPDEENNRIIYGLKAVTGINGETIQKIVENRPYISLQDFLKRTPLNKTAMISLIKAGAFDQFEERKNIMREYVWSVCEPKKRLTLQNFNALIEANLIPQEINFQKRVFVFNKALKANCKFEDYYSLKSDNYYKFYTKFFDVDLLEPLGNKVGIKQKTWKKLYDEAMKPAKEYLKNHQDELLDKLNNSIFDTIWNKYAQGNYSSWEMDSLGMYYHKHELSSVDNKIYEIDSFKNLPTSPEVETTFKRKGAEIPIYKLHRIAGTVIAKDDMHSSISVLTVDSGVVTVKMNRDYYAMYNRRISEVQKDGTKKVIEQSWFSKGTLVVLQGIRRGDSFFLKNYKRSAYHQLYKITEIHSNGTVEMTNDRVDSEE